MKCPGGQHIFLIQYYLSHCQYLFCGAGWAELIFHVFTAVGLSDQCILKTYWCISSKQSLLCKRLSVHAFSFVFTAICLHCYLYSLLLIFTVICLHRYCLVIADNMNKRWLYDLARCQPRPRHTEGARTVSQPLSKKASHWTKIHNRHQQSVHNRPGK